MASIEITVPRRQAMLTVKEPHYINGQFESIVVEMAPVLVWPDPTMEGLFVVECQDGTVKIVHPSYLTFLDGKELFDQYDWSKS